MAPRRQTIALIAIGSNLGDSASNVALAFARLQDLSAAPVLCSRLWRSDPVDCPPGSPPFVNAAAVITPFPEETPESLLRRLQGMEKELGRLPKTVMNEARPLDLDLIAFGSERRNEPELTLPHPRAHLRRFVLAPLAEVAPDFVLPGARQNIAELLASSGDAERVELFTPGQSPA